MSTSGNSLLNLLYSRHNLEIGACLPIFVLKGGAWKSLVIGFRGRLNGTEIPKRSVNASQDMELFRHLCIKHMSTSIRRLRSEVI